MTNFFTAHARTRMQQRGIPPAAIEALLDDGRSAPAGRGCEVLFFDKAARKGGRLARTYAVLGSDGAVITVGHRYRRLPKGEHRC
jgi:hypothetical protein